MRKSILSSTTVTKSPIHEAWRDLVRITRVEMTSENEAFPIENALGKVSGAGWRAANPGPQILQLHFDEPLTIRRIQLHFVEQSVERSQEFSLFAKGGDGVLREVVRQQWTFSPGGATEELEDYPVSLTGVTLLELRLDPDRSHDPAQSRSYATLRSLKVA